MKLLFRPLVVGALLAGSSGCAALLVGGAGAAGYAGYKYLKGDAKQFYPHPLAQTWNALRQSVDQLGLPVTYEAADQFGAQLESMTADGKKITIKLLPRGHGTELRVRVGVFGDEYVSKRLLAQVTQQLTGGENRDVESIVDRLSCPPEKMSL